MLSVVSPLSALKSIIWRGVRPYRSWIRAGSYMIVPPAPMRVNIRRRALRHQLEHVQVARDDDRVDALLLRLEAERADEVVRLVAVQVEDGDPERGERLAHDGELLAQVVRGGPAGPLVGAVHVGALGPADIEAADDVVRLGVLEAAQHDAPEPERGIDQLPLAGRQRRLDEREVRAIDEAVRVDAA